MGMDAWAGITGYGDLVMETCTKRGLHEIPGKAGNNMKPKNIKTSRFSMLKAFANGPKHTLFFDDSHGITFLTGGDPEDVHTFG
jgi:hypothetical protein